MADNNNALLGQIPKTPYPALKTLDRLIGTWKITGPDVDGQSTFEWMEGGFFLIHHFQMGQGDEKVKGIEYIYYDPDTQTLRTHMMDKSGANFTYTWDVTEKEFWNWFGEKGSNNFSHSTFSADGNTLTGRWQWPNPDGTQGGYAFSMTRVK
jgi:hypothetical protein